MLLASAAFAQKSPLSVEINDADGHRAKDAQVRIERVDKKAAPLLQKTDSHGEVTANLEVGTYKLTAISPTGAQSSQTVKTSASKKMRVSFDMKRTGTAANDTAKKKIYHWVDSPTGTHMLGHWEEVNNPQAIDNSGRPVENVSAESLHRAGLGMGGSRPGTP